MDSQIDQLVNQIAAEKDPFTKAKQIKKIIDDFGLRLNQLAKKLSLKPSYLCHYLRLNRLPELVVDGYYNGDITLSHLFVLSRLKKFDQIKQVYEEILIKNLTVLKTEERVREIIYGIKTEGEMLTAGEKEKYLNKINGDLRLKIIQTRIKSKLEIEIKGSLAKTTKILRKVLDRLTGFSPNQPYPEDNNGKTPGR